MRTRLSATFPSARTRRLPALLSGLMLVWIVCLAPTLPAQSPAESERCIGSGQELAVQSAIRPFRLGAPVADGFILQSLSIEAHRIVVTLANDDKHARLLLLPPGRADLPQVLHFSIQTEGDSLAAHALNLLVRRIVATAYDPWSACMQPIEPSPDLIGALDQRTATSGWLGVALLAASVLSLYSLAFFLHRRGKKAGTGLALLASSALFTLLVVESIWRVAPLKPGLSLKLRDGCYDSNPRGTFTPVPIAGHPEWTIYCVGGSTRTWAECEQPESSPQTPAHRILALGDSFSEALGVRYEESWPRLLENRLNADAQTSPARVVNCARSGANSAEILSRYREFAPLHKPDIVVYAWVLNDPLVPRGPDGLPVAEISFQPETREELTGRLAAYPLLNLLVEQSALGRYFVDRWVTRQVALATEQAYRQLYAEPITPEFARALDSCAELAKEVRAEGGRLLVAIWPLLVTLDEYPFLQAHQMIARELARRDIETLDLLPALKSRSAESLWVHPSDYHPNEIAQELAAEAIEARLKQVGWLKAE